MLTYADVWIRRMQGLAAMRVFKLARLVKLGRVAKLMRLVNLWKKMCVKQWQINIFSLAKLCIGGR